MVSFSSGADLKDGLWKGEYDPSKFSADEVPLLKIIQQFQRRLEVAARNLDPAAIAEYLYELSGAYQRYYDLGRHDMLKRVLAEDEPIRRARLAVSAAVQQTLRNGC